MSTSTDNESNPMVTPKQGVPNQGTPKRGAKKGKKPSSTEKSKSRLIVVSGVPGSAGGGGSSSSSSSSSDSDSSGKVRGNNRKGKTGSDKTSGSTDGSISVSNGKHSGAGSSPHGKASKITESHPPNPDSVVPNTRRNKRNNVEKMKSAISAIPISSAGPNIPGSAGGGGSSSGQSKSKFTPPPPLTVARNSDGSYTVEGADADAQFVLINLDENKDPVSQPRGNTGWICHRLDESAFELFARTNKPTVSYEPLDSELGYICPINRSNAFVIVRDGNIHVVTLHGRTSRSTGLDMSRIRKDTINLGFIYDLLKSVITEEMLSDMEGVTIQVGTAYTGPLGDPQNVKYYIEAFYRDDAWHAPFEDEEMYTLLNRWTWTSVKFACRFPQMVVPTGVSLPGYISQLDKEDAKTDVHLYYASMCSGVRQGQVVHRSEAIDKMLVILNDVKWRLSKAVCIQITELHATYFEEVIKPNFDESVYPDYVPFVLSLLDANKPAMDMLQKTMRYDADAELIVTRK